MWEWNNALNRKEIPDTNWWTTNISQWNCRELKEILSKHISTIEGLPKNQQIPQGFEPICRVDNPYYKNTFLEDFIITRYCIAHCGVTLCTDQVRTVLIKDKNENPLMYAYIIEMKKKYILMEIGSSQVYEVSKDTINIEDVEYYRAPFAKSKKGLIISVRNNENEEYVQELWLRDATTKKEIKLDFPGGSVEKAFEYFDKKFED